MVGVFCGASILSFKEIIVWTVRLIGGYEERKIKTRRLPA